MWAYLPLVSSAEGECSTRELNLHSARCSTQSLMWNASPSLLTSLPQRWRNNAWLRRLSGLTLEPFAAHCSVITFAREQAAKSAPCSQATHVRTSAAPVAEQAYKALKDRFGGTSLKRLRSMNRSSCFWKTWEDTLLRDSIPFAVRFARWVTALRRDSLRRQKSVRRTSGNGFLSSLNWNTLVANPEAPNKNCNQTKPGSLLEQVKGMWATPRAGGNSSGSEQRLQEGSNPGLADQAQETNWRSPAAANCDQGAKPPEATEGQDKPMISLTDQAGNWPSARAVDAKSTGNHPGKMDSLLGVARSLPPSMATEGEDAESCGNHPDATDSLTGAVKYWPTPNPPNGGRGMSAEDVAAKGKTAKGKRQVHLGAVARIWPTPKASGQEDPETLIARKGQQAAQMHNLTAAASMAIEGEDWPTPRASEFKGCGPVGSKSHQYMLDRQYLTATASQFSHQDQAKLKAGLKSSASIRQLNPRFVSWLMAWPAGHSASDCSATEWFRWKRRMLTSLLVLVCGEQNDSR